MAELNHPQPWGAFGFPAGMLLIPTGHDDIQRDLLAGRLPSRWPAELRTHELVHQGSLEEVIDIPVTDEISRYHRYLVELALHGPQPVPDLDDPLLVLLADIALVSVGGPLSPRLEGDDLEDLPTELAAMVLASRGTALVWEGEPEGRQRIREAAEISSLVSPALHGILLATAGSLAHEAGDLDAAATTLAQAAEALLETDLGEVRAELLYRLGAIAHEQANASGSDYSTAIDYYLEGLRLVNEDTAPEMWASLNLNLATAHLAAPMTQASDQLRIGVATASLRACRRVFTPEEHPAGWSTATQNLANALVYAPSTHHRDNLLEAIELYEEVLRSGVRDLDQLGRARLIANQGNVLAHLGAYADAEVKLADARFLFEEALDHDGVATVRSIQDQIAKAQVADPDHELGDLTRQANKMSQMPTQDVS